MKNGILKNAPEILSRVLDLKKATTYVSIPFGMEQIGSCKAYRRNNCKLRDFPHGWNFAAFDKVKVDHKLTSMLSIAN